MVVLRSGRLSLLEQKFDGRWRWVAIGAGLAIAGVFSYRASTLPVPTETVAVVAFENHAGREGQQLCDGVGKTTANLLENATELKPRYALFSYSEGRKQKANLLVSGAVRPSGANLSIALILTSTWRMRQRDARMFVVRRNIQPAQLKQVLAEQFGLLLIGRPLKVAGS